VKSHSCPNLTWGRHLAEPSLWWGESGVPVKQGGLQVGRDHSGLPGGTAGQWGRRPKDQGSVFSQESVGYDPEGGWVHSLWGYDPEVGGTVPRSVGL